MDGISTMMSEHNSELPASMFDEIVDVDDESVRMSDSMVESIITCARFIGGRERCDVDREARAPNMACTLLQAQDAFLRSPESTCHLNLFGMPGCTEDPQTIFHAAILILTYHPLVAALEEAGEKGVWLLQTLVATVVCQGVLLGRSRACARADTFLAIALEHISTQVGCPWYREHYHLKMIAVCLYCCSSSCFIPSVQRVVVFPGRGEATRYFQFFIRCDPCHSILRCRCFLREWHRVGAADID